MSETANDRLASLSKTQTQEDAEKPKKTPSIIDQLSRTRTKEEIAESKRLKAQGLDKVKSSEPAIEEEAPRGREATDTPATETAKPKPRHPDDERPSMALAPKSTRVQERDISPGTMPDGSHVKCSGEKGESYVPPTGGLGKLANKVRHL